MDDGAQSRAELAQETSQIAFNEEDLLNEETKIMADPSGFSLIRYEAKGKGPMDLNAEQRKMDKEELKTYFDKKGGTDLLKNIFDEGLAALKKLNAPITMEGIVKQGLSLYEYTDYRARLAAVKSKERNVLKQSIRKPESKAKESGIPLRENPEPIVVPGRATGERPLEEENMSIPGRATGTIPTVEGRATGEIPTD